MAASELQDRLDYLVSYASQLIFINGETAEQSSILDTFISESPEQVEIALLSASLTTTLAKYRETIFRQLVSQNKNADFNRPLNQLLVALNQHNGPLIISISKAENLPDKLLQELWELVLQSRFANNKQHLNVLLFAQGAWAKQARNQLQSRTGDKPLLLNNAASLPQLKQGGSELDKLISLKRQQFSERLQKRAQQQIPSLPLLKRKSVIATFIGVFLLLFAGMVSLQYPELFASAPEESTVLNATEQQNRSIPGAETLKTTELTSLVNPDNTATSEPIAETLENKPLVADEIASSPDPLVTTWRSALAKIEEKPSQYLVAKPQQAFIEQQEKAAQQKNHTAETSVVPNRTIEPTNTAAPTNTPVNKTPTLAKTVTPSKPGAMPSGLTLQDGQYLIQISAMSDDYLLQQFMQESPLGQQVWGYTTQRFGGDWHVLLYNQVYPDLDSARAALAKFPSSITTYEPFVKSARQIKQELAQKAG